MTSALLGGIPLPTQGGDQLVSKVASAAIAALFKRTGKVEANVRVEPVAKLLQGSIDGFDFISNSLEMYNGLRINAMELYLQAVAIDVGAIFGGTVKLKQPTQATMRVVLTEEDLTTSFNTPFVIGKLQQLVIDGNALHFQNTRMTLNDDKSFRVRTEIRKGEASEPIEIDFTSRLDVRDRSQVLFTDVTHAGTDEAIALGKVLVEHVNSLLDLDKFALDGTQLRVDRVRVQKDKIVFYGVAAINQFPQRKSKAA